MLLDTFRNTLVKKFLGNDLVPRLVKYLIKCPHYITKSGRKNTFGLSLCVETSRGSSARSVGVVGFCLHVKFSCNLQLLKKFNFQEKFEDEGL